MFVLFWNALRQESSNLFEQDVNSAFFGRRKPSQAHFTYFKLNLTSRIIFRFAFIWIKMYRAPPITF